MKLAKLLAKVEKDVADTRAIVRKAERRTTAVRKSQADDKIKAVMHEFKAGTLKTPTGKPVTDRDQALAIALAESRRVAKDLNDEIGEGTVEEQNEHGFTPQQALQVALDHLKKNPRYYSTLKKYGLD